MLVTLAKYGGEPLLGIVPRRVKVRMCVRACGCMCVCVFIFILILILVDFGFDPAHPTHQPFPLSPPTQALYTTAGRPLPPSPTPDSASLTLSEATGNNNVVPEDVRRALRGEVEAAFGALGGELVRLHKVREGVG